MLVLQTICKRFKRRANLRSRCSTIELDHPLLTKRVFINIFVSVRTSTDTFWKWNSVVLYTIADFMLVTRITQLSSSACMCFCLGTEVPRHNAGSVGTYDRMVVCTYVRCMLIIFITNDTALRMLKYCKKGIPSMYLSSRMWWDWFIHVHTSRCKLHSYTVVYTSTRCLAHNVTHSISISLLSSFALRAYKDNDSTKLIPQITAHHLSKPSAMPMH